MIKVDIDGIFPIVKKRREIDSIGGTGEFGATAALTDDSLVEQLPGRRIRRVVVDPTLLVRSLELLGRDYRLPEKDRPKAVFARQGASEPHITRVGDYYSAGQRGEIEFREIHLF